MGTRNVVVRRTGVTDQVYEQLRNLILSREFAPQERLVETTIAAQLGVSRTPVREAIRRLEEAGLVERLPYGGVVTVDIGREIHDRYGLRARVEGYAAFLAAQRRTDGDAKRLRELAAKGAIAKERTLKERSILNNSFHQAILAASQYPRLTSLTEAVPGYFLGHDTLSLYAYDGTTAAIIAREHTLIAEAIYRQNPPIAEKLVRDHFDALADIEKETILSGSHDTVGLERVDASC